MSHSRKNNTSVADAIANGTNAAIQKELNFSVYDISQFIHSIEARRQAARPALLNDSDEAWNFSYGGEPNPVRRNLSPMLFKPVCENDDFMSQLKHHVEDTVSEQEMKRLHQ